MIEGACVHQSNVGEPELALEASILHAPILQSLDVCADTSGSNATDAAAPARRYEPALHGPKGAGGADAHHAHDGHGIAPEAEHAASGFVRGVTMAAVVVPPIALVATMVLAWGGWFHWVDLALFFGMYVITGLGITVGYHRLYTHKSFHTRGPIAAFFAICGSMAGQGPVVWWAATHRKHHQHSDHEHDPHSPHAGRQPGVVGAVRAFLHAHMGWLFADLTPDLKRYVPDLVADRTTMRISAMFPYLVLVGFAIPAVIGGLVTMSWMGALLGFLWGGVVRMCVLHHVTWSVNSVCHLWGAKDYHSGDESRNNAVMGILAFGEGWHNNHHAFPASARHGLKWWQFDSSWVIIRTLERVGLAKKVRLPAAERLAARKA
jgi:stearoyl-CoA desaturase (delta-9 desaturase)